RRGGNSPGVHRPANAHAGKRTGNRSGKTAFRSIIQYGNPQVGLHPLAPHDYFSTSCRICHSLLPPAPATAPHLHPAATRTTRDPKTAARHHGRAPKATAEPAQGATRLTRPAGDAAQHLEPPQAPGPNPREPLRTPGTFQTARRTRANRRNEQARHSYRSPVTGTATSGTPGL